MPLSRRLTDIKTQLVQAIFMNNGKAFCDTRDMWMVHLAVLDDERIWRVLYYAFQLLR